MTVGKTPKSFGYAECENCQNEYEKVASGQRWCSDYCRKQHKIKEVNKKWVKSGSKESKKNDS
jgi:hypothetical protein